MKSVPFLFLLFVILSNCQSDKAIKPVSPSGCSDPKYTRVRLLENVAAVVIAKTYTTANGSNFTNYYLDQPDTAGFSALWVACNLPDAYKKDRLPVRINGYILIYPGIENENSIGSPIELTRIEVR